MSTKIRSAAAAAFLCVVVAAALSLVSREPSVSVPPPIEARRAATADQPRESSLVGPGELAALFAISADRASRAAVRSARGARPGSPEPPQPHRDRVAPAAPPAPLRYLGWVRRGGTERGFLFADNTTGRVYEVGAGRPAGRWTLVEHAGDRFVLSDGSAVYTVAGR